LSEQHTAAFIEVVQLYAADIAKLPQPAEAGIWLVQDAAGHRISSGVLKTFPAKISSENYGQIVPGAAGQRAIEFGFARTPVVGAAGPFRVAYVTVEAAPPAGARPHQFPGAPAGRAQARGQCRWRRAA
jgi:hypothetical protein